MAICPLITLSYLSHVSYLGLKRTNYAIRVEIPCLTCCLTYTSQVRQLRLIRLKLRVVKKREGGDFLLSLFPELTGAASNTTHKGD